MSVCLGCVVYKGRSVKLGYSKITLERELNMHFSRYERNFVTGCACSTSGIKMGYYTRPEYCKQRRMLQIMNFK
jgi:hypothetical protein